MITFRNRICTVVFNVFPGIVVVHPRELMAGNLDDLQTNLFVSSLLLQILYSMSLSPLFQMGVKSEILAKDLIIMNLL